jgi:hypothetical protein
MKEFDLKIINNIIFPDIYIKKEILNNLRIKKLSEFANNKNNFSETDLFLLRYYEKTISEYTKKDRNSIKGSYFLVFFYLYLGKTSWIYNDI